MTVYGRFPPLSVGCLGPERQDRDSNAVLSLLSAETRHKTAGYVNPSSHTARTQSMPRGQHGALSADLTPLIF